MSNLIKFDIENLGEGTPGKPIAGREVEGSPSFNNWRVDDAGDGVKAGVWEVTPGAYHRLLMRWKDDDETRECDKGQLAALAPFDFT
jgi:uncharacterized cupin superfamily protein